MPTNRDWTRGWLRQLLALALALAGLLAPVRGVDPAYAADFTVNAATDTHDANQGNGICADSGGQCSLRAALEEAFSSSPITINFSLPAGTVITLSNAAGFGTLPWYGSNITVSGSVVVSGAALGDGKDILAIEGNDNTLLGLTLRDAPRHGLFVGDSFGVGGGNRNLIQNVTIIGSSQGSGASQGAGVYVYGGAAGGGQDNVIRDNRIGVISEASTPCVESNANRYGVYITTAAGDTRVEQNLIACNWSYGVFVYGLSGTPTGTEVMNNRIGSNGTVALGNGEAGVRVSSQAHDVLISHNLISGNIGAGVHVAFSTQAVTLTGNYIGTNLAGTAAIANTAEGVLVDNAAYQTYIGGNGDFSQRNIISGNTLTGVRVRESASNTYIDGNYIGLDASGLSPLPNGLHGVWIDHAHDAYISSLTTGGLPQHISGNAWDGVVLVNTDYVRIGPATRIGTASDGFPVGNAGAGLYLFNATDTRVTAGLIAHNGGAGVVVAGSASAGNWFRIQTNKHNGGLPIDLGFDGHTPNDAGDGDTGPNQLLNYAHVTAAAGSTITGTVCGHCTVDVYAALGNPGAPGGGGTWLLAAEANADGLWTATLPPGYGAGDLSLMACQGVCEFSGNSSEMRPRPQAFLPSVQR